MATNTSDSRNLPADVVADLLADDRRHRALELLADDGTLTLEELARRLAAEEAGRPDPPGELVAEIETELWDDHVPKLTATDVVEYDSMRAAVTLTPATPIREEL